MFDVRCSMFDVRMFECSMFDVRCSMFDVSPFLLEVLSPKHCSEMDGMDRMDVMDAASGFSSVRCSMFDVRCSMFDVRCSMFDVRCSMFDVRCSMFDVRCSMFDVSPFRSPKPKAKALLLSGAGMPFWHGNCLDLGLPTANCAGLSPSPSP